VVFKADDASGRTPARVVWSGGTTPDDCGMMRLRI
jgi:hypothetical protein